MQVYMCDVCKCISVHVPFHNNVKTHTCTVLQQVPYLTSNPSAIFSASVFIIACSSLARTAALLSAKCMSRLLIICKEEEKEDS